MSRHAAVQPPGNEDVAYLNDLQAALLAQRPPTARWLIYLIAGVSIVALTWAATARVEEITQAQGKVISQSREQLVQSLEGGLVAVLHVAEGDVVAPGQLLVTLDRARASADFEQGLAQVLGLQAAVARLRAEAYGQPLDLQSIAERAPQLAADERRAFDTRQRDLQQSLKALRANLTLANQEIQLTEPLAGKGLISTVELLRMRRQASELDAQIVERGNRHRAEAQAELARHELELAQAEAALKARADVLARTELRAPLHGTVKNVRANTLGGVVRAGEVIMEITALQDQLLIEAKVLPGQVAFLRPGLHATVKLSAYDYNIYGGLTGKVQQLSADTFVAEPGSRGANDPESWYRLLVLTDTAALQAGNQTLPVTPGMLATVDIRTGEKTILHYMLKPLFKAREAFRER
ncbi:HlyD family efflux transporter periplasmic adaptor subunit [Pseudomonas sp. CFBP 8771]|uniref:HlyD family efflux transporter periplasmic adaptor subunit n=1 Tax=Pseudomonas sp. CFBP 8771 TaxID=2775285 RepID=UPI00177C8BC1|nr:HlyD family efflux transporter periplasmic adaptor subunit [Pseudomonas sp. CFBP 8771]MBD8604254.1 HlyD family efflux transporter periplasmic adaptor subunit [Pseudomonas sp. CFBP 8771]